MESSRPKTPGKRNKVLLGKGILGLVLTTCFGLGLMGGFALALILDPYALRLKETPFGPETLTRMPKGKDFDGLGDLHDLSKAEQTKYRELLALAAGEDTGKAGEDAGKASGDAGALAGMEALADSHGKNPLVVATWAWLASRRDAPADAAEAGYNSYELGLARLAPARADHPDHPWLLYVAGLLQEKSGRPDSAEALYHAALKASPQFAYPHVGLGRISMERAATGPAFEAFRKAIGLMETSPELYHAGDATALPAAEAAPFDWLATLYMQVGAPDSARMALEYGQGKGWQTLRMSLVQGWLWEASGFMPKADSVYRSLIAKDPGNDEYARALNTLGWKPFKPPQGKTAASDAVFAISLLDPLARQSQRNGPLWMALGQAYYRRGLFGMAAECFDSSLKADPGLPGLSEKRDLAYQALIAETAWAARASAATRPAGDREPRRSKPVPSPEEQTPVVLPGTIALLGAYSVSWGSTPVELRGAYPGKTFRNLPGGDLMDVFVHDGVKHEYLLAFKEGKLWGVRVFVTDSAGVGGDIFGRLIRTKTKISGEGKGTGEATCPGYLPFQGAIWENDDTFEFMAQFIGKENQVRLARIDRKHLPQNRRLCDLVPYLQTETWQKK